MLVQIIAMVLPEIPGRIYFISEIKPDVLALLISSVTLVNMYRSRKKYNLTQWLGILIVLFVRKTPKEWVYMPLNSPNQCFLSKIACSLVPWVFTLRKHVNMLKDMKDSHANVL